MDDLALDLGFSILNASNTKSAGQEKKRKQSQLDIQINSAKSSIRNICRSLPECITDTLLLLPFLDHDEHSIDAITDRIETIENDLKRINNWKDFYQKELTKDSMDKENFVILEDASQGTFPFAIPCINDVDNDPFPNIKWIGKNIFGKGVPQEQFDIPGCDCYPTCDDAVECLCAAENNQKFPYTKDGKIKREVGFPVYECNRNCACNKTCRNRVMQKGPTYPLEIFKTADKGWAVRSQVDIPKGAFVCEYIGEVITTDEAEKRGKHYDMQKCSYLYDLDMEDNQNCFTVDAWSCGNVSRFINHSCNPNLQNWQVWVENLDKRLPHVAFFARRNIKRGEELSFDYRYTPGKGKGGHLECHCGAPNCRKILY